MRQGVLIAAFSLLSAVAVAGWMRRPAQAPAMTPQLTTAGYMTPEQAVYGAPQQQQFAPAAAAVAAPVPASVVYRQAPVRTQRVAARPASTSPVVVRQKRPFSHSAAIVAGSAGAGAVVGALAGGKKGAAIGALAGGGAGLIYDRVTANKQRTAMSY
jgi:hypothetical protein